MRTRRVHRRWEAPIGAFLIGALVALSPYLTAAHTGPRVGSPWVTGGPGDALARGPAPPASTSPISPLTGNLAWTNISTFSTETPPCGGDGSLAYYPPLKEFVMFGGTTGCASSATPTNSTWTYANGSWTNVTSSLPQAPAARYAMGMVYDAKDRYLVAFGGATGAGGGLGIGGPQNDTWIFNGTWTNVTYNQTSSPLAEFNGGMVYDGATQSVVLVDGFNNVGLWYNANQTWSFSGGHWTNLSPPTLPPAVHSPGLVYDSATSSILLYGGDLDTTAVSNTTWSFANGSWTQVVTATTPPAVYDPTMFYDALDATPILFGGLTVPPPIFAPINGTWSFRNGSWSNITSSVAGSPSARGGGRAAWDPDQNWTLLFGGRTNNLSPLVNDTWAFPRAPLLGVRISPAAPATDLGSPLNVTVAPLGGVPPLTYTYTGLPPGCASRNASALSCIPTANGTFALTVNVSDATGLRESAHATVTVYSALTASMAASTQELDVGEELTLHGFPHGGGEGYSYRFSGLPTGCSSTNSTILNCTPTASGAFAVVFHARDGVGSSAASVPVNVTVLGAVTVGLRFPAPAVDIGQTVLLTADVSGGLGPYTVTWSGLPGGCSTMNTTLLSCSPTLRGNYSVSVQAVDSLGGVGSSAPLALSVSPELRAAFPSTNFQWEVGVPVLMQAAVNGGTPPLRYTWTTLPPGCSALLTGLDCVPSSAGTFTFGLQVSDGALAQVQVNASVTVVPGLSVGILASHQSIDQGTGLELTAVVGGGGPPYAYDWSVPVALGCLGTGAALNCTPALPGAESVSVSVSDPLGGLSNGSVQIQVLSPLLATFSTSATPSCAAPFAVQLTALAAGGDPAYAYNWSFGDGSFTTGSASPTHSYSAAGNFTVTLTVRDQGAGRAVHSGVVSVAPTVSICSMPPPGGGAAAGSSSVLGNPLLWVAIVAALIVVLGAAYLARRPRPPAPETGPEPSPYDGLPPELALGEEGDPAPIE